MKDGFTRLTDEEKMTFMKAVMPSFRETFAGRPEKMMAEMMPFCRDMMKSMGMMGGGMGADKS